MNLAVPSWSRIELRRAVCSLSPPLPLPLSHLSCPPPLMIGSILTLGLLLT